MKSEIPQKKPRTRKVKNEILAEEEKNETSEEIIPTKTIKKPRKPKEQPTEDKPKKKRVLTDEQVSKMIIGRQKYLEKKRAEKDKIVN